MTYVEKETVLKKIENAFMWSRSFGNLYEEVQEIPASDVSPVRHGNWSLRCDVHRDNVTGEVDEDYYLECSECKRKVFDISQDAVICGRWADVVKDFPYCHCGAKMEM